MVREFWQSTIGKKMVMAVTGLIGVGFVVGHLLGNLQIFVGPGRFNAYSHFLHSLGELLWLVRLVLIAAVVLHVVAAVQLSRRRLVARPVRYKHGSQREVSTFAARTIRWGGGLLLLFIVFHILHFTTRSIFRDYSATDVYDNVVRGFGIWWVVVFYVLAMAALGLHVHHGVWSSLRTLGASKASPEPRRRPVAVVLALLLWAGFTVIPLAVFAGLVRPPASRGTVSAPPPVAARNTR